MSREAEKIIQSWLDELSYSAATWDLDAHMKLVSRQVKVTGLPRVKSVDYQGWKLRRHNEFKKKLLRSLNYRLGKVLHADHNKIVFWVEETVKDHQGKAVAIDKEITLNKEEDGLWRVLREHYREIRRP